MTGLVICSLLLSEQTVLLPMLSAGHCGVSLIFGLYDKGTDYRQDGVVVDIGISDLRVFWGESMDVSVHSLCGIWWDITDRNNANV